jgi:hypothetical protein
MPQTLSSITNEITDSIRAHYATGYFDRDTALARLRVAAFAERAPEEAEVLLDSPIDPQVVKEYTGRPVCIRCTTTPSAGTCCSSHGKELCHGCYRRTHFVEVCVEGCVYCAREGLSVRGVAR